LVVCREQPFDLNAAPGRGLARTSLNAALRLATGC
jgi:hypothetical protein